MDGTYTLCFSNRMSTMTPKMVMFVMDTGETRQLADVGSATNDNVTRKFENNEKKSSIDFNFVSFLYLVHHNKLEELVSELGSSLNNIKREQEFMEIRERIHRSSELIE